MDAYSRNPAENTSLNNLGKSSRGTTQQSSKTSKVLLEATRNFGCIQRPSREQVNEYKELFYQLIERVSASDKRLISAMLARGVFTPRAVALYLAQDKTDVAAPFLLYSPVLGDLDLRAIARKKGADHAAIVAKRRMPMDDYTKSTLLEVTSKELQAIQQKAPEPESLPVTAASVLPAVEPPSSPKWLASEEIVALASIGGRLGRQEKAETRSEIKSEISTNAIAHANVHPSVKANFQLPKSETRQLLQLARQRKVGELAAFIQNLCGLESAATMKLVQSQKTELTYLVKALGLSAPHDIQLLMMLSPVISRDVAIYRETKNLLAGLDVGICRMIFNEIGARFDIGNGKGFAPSVTGSSSKFTQAVQRRKDSLNSMPEQRSAQKPSSRFSFEQSFLATG
jgi:hypothetical protein